MAQFKKKDGGVPFPRTMQEWVDKGLSPGEALHRTTQDVFGKDFHRQR
jgi:hypothetical protein